MLNNAIQSWVWLGLFKIGGPEWIEWQQRLDVGSTVSLCGLVIATLWVASFVSRSRRGA